MMDLIEVESIFQNSSFIVLWNEREEIAEQ